MKLKNLANSIGALACMPVLVSCGQMGFFPGDTNFNSADRIAINDVIDAYGIYWDNNDLESYLSLFTDDAVGVTYRPNGERVEMRIKDEYAIVAKERMGYFESNLMQRRKMMANQLLIELDDDDAYLHQYMTLLTTNNHQATEIVSSVVYVFKLRKIQGLWKISYREVNKTDAKLDLQFK
ncbi:MAG: nuclear transport factor 2 family protein [Planctomycetes bacterium]|nr:nuclear transport factor 2 family protein [Planctomycetota bacterium]